MRYDNSYIGFLTTEADGPYYHIHLPIFERYDYFDTNYFKDTLEEVVLEDIKYLRLLERKQEFEKTFRC